MSSTLLKASPQVSENDNTVVAVTVQISSNSVRDIARKDSAFDSTPKTSWAGEVEYEEGNNHQVHVNNNSNADGNILEPLYHLEMFKKHLSLSNVGLQ